MIKMAELARNSVRVLSSSNEELRNRALLAIASKLEGNVERLLAENAKDVAIAKEENLTAPLLSRLMLTESKCQRIVEGLKQLATLPDPLGHVTYAKTVCEKMNLYRVTTPIGVIGVIFESRPDALVQISALCLKSGNATLLKGGREALLTNRLLTKLILEATTEVGIPDGWCALMETREDVNQMLALDEYIDLIIPRGSNEFVRYIMDNSHIPVLGHADGICHVYVDAICDLEMAKKVAIDSKTQNLSVCNAAETLLIHQAIADELLPDLANELYKCGVEVRGDEKVAKLIDCKKATSEDWDTEYLDAIVSIAIVENIDEAIAHINKHGSHHTDAIVSSDMLNVNKFMREVDSAGVFHNCSTRFADGFVFGLGAEVGIATGKLHARGPMGLEGLCTYQYRLYGHGETMQGLNEGLYHLEHANIAPVLPK